MKTDRLDKSDATKKSRTLRPTLPTEIDRQVGRFPERLESLIPEREQREFSRKIGISEGALRSYLKGTSIPSLDRLVAFALNTNVNLLWLATGEGPKQGESTTCALNVEALTRALGIVEKVGAGLPPERKARLGAAIYSLYIRSGEAVDPALVEEVVRSARGDASQSM